MIKDDKIEFLENQSRRNSIRFNSIPANDRPGQLKEQKWKWDIP